MVNFTNNQNNAPGSMPPPGAVTPQQAQQNASPVEELMINYNARFKKGTPAKYRDKEIFSVISQLMMSQKSCSLLVGAPGTGKTKIVEEIARLIANKSPYTTTLNDYIIYELPLTNLMAGTSFRGQLEDKVKDVIAYCEKEKVIVFIDEIHQLIGSNSAYENIAQMLKPAMARGSIKIIGATTTQESKNLLDDPAFNRRFNKVQVCELSIEQTRDIIETVYLPKMSGFYGIGFAANIAQAVTMAAERSKTITCHRPDNAITLLDQVCANTVLQRNYNIATCVDETIRQTMQSTPLVINQKHIDDFGKDTGFTVPDNFNPVKSVLFYRDSEIDKLHDAIEKHVRISALFPDKKPFVIDIKGDTKSGRTTLATECARLIDEQPVYLDLSDYSDAPSLNRIIGSPAGYVGFDSKKEMPFDIVESNPYKIIILDNVDKGHQVVQEFFRSAVDTAMIKYADNRLIDISKCIIIRTSEKTVRTRNIGFMESKSKNAPSEIILDVLSEQEIVDATERLISDMVRTLKTDHPKYTTIPDSIALTDDAKSKLAGPADMLTVARETILSVI